MTERTDHARGLLTAFNDLQRLFIERSSKAAVRSRKRDLTGDVRRRAEDARVLWNEAAELMQAAKRRAFGLVATVGDDGDDLESEFA